MELPPETAKPESEGQHRARIGILAADMVAGGPQATVAPDWVLREIPVVDCVLAGEAEELLPALAWAVARGISVSPSDVPRRVLKETGWHVRRAAALFGVSRATFYRKLDKHGISRPAKEPA